MIMINKLFTWLMGLLAPKMTVERTSISSTPDIQSASISTVSGTVQVSKAAKIPVTSSEASFTAIPDNFIHAIIMQESRGNVGAIGDLKLKDHAYGPMQIRQPVCIDVNNRFKLNLQAQQMLNNLELSTDTFKKYMSIYFPKGGSFEQMAMAWNGGGEYYLLYGKKGYEKYTADLDAYWKGVQIYLA